MPKTMRTCCEPGCPAATLTPYCSVHQKDRQRRSDTKTADERAFYGSRRWKAVRAQHRERHPLCAECERNGRVTAGELVDHIVPMREGGDPWDSANHQTLCNECHQRKRAQERAAGGHRG